MKELAPKPGSRPSGQSLPKADVLIVTWTMDEGHALSRVLTPGLDSRDDWKPYLFKTTDFGKTWTRIVAPEQGVRGYAHVVKEDAVKPSLLFVGTEFGGRQLQYKMFSSASQPVVNRRMFRSYDWNAAKALVNRCLGEY